MLWDANLASNENTCISMNVLMTLNNNPPSELYLKQPVYIHIHDDELPTSV